MLTGHLITALPVGVVDGDRDEGDSRDLPDLGVAELAQLPYSRHDAFDGCVVRLWPSAV